MTHAGSSTPSSQYQFPTSTGSAGNYHHMHHHHNHHLHHHGHYSYRQGPSGHYQSNHPDDYSQRSSKLRFEKSRRSVATNHSEASDYSIRPSEHNAAPSIASFKTASERDPDRWSIQRGLGQQEPSEATHDSSLTLRRSESRSKGASEVVAEHILHSRARKSAQLSPSSADQNSIDGSSIRRTHYVQPLHLSGGGASVSSGKVPVTPVDFTFQRRRHEGTSGGAGYSSIGGETGITYSGRRIAQAIILIGLENASQEVYATLLEMVINKEINDRNRYIFPDLIIIAIFNSPNVPENIPKQLLDYFAINGSYQFSASQPRIQPTPSRKPPFFRRTELDDLTKRMKVVTVSNDMMRYIRDIIVGVRTHEAVHGGLTPRAALDLEAILK
ncbi:MAG: hypothetical protein J3Q66DRAFT_61554 [Benniella sp.]|nr:MAG: hypothetical protein J3Q66DRAFT_61554 [Benniella sp.]